MNAKLFESKSEKEIRLSNGVQFFAEKGETKEAFIARVTEVIERDYVDNLELTEVDPAILKRKSTKQLQKSSSNATGVELRMIQEILVERGALEEHPSEGGSIYNGTQTDEDLQVEVPQSLDEENLQLLEELEPKLAEEAKKTGTSKKEKAPKKEKTPEKENEPLKKQLTDEEILIKLSESEMNKGHEVTFICTKTKEVTKGIIKGVRLDKRNNFIQYRILAEDGNMYGKGVDSVYLKIGELAHVTVKEKVSKKDTVTEEIIDLPEDIQPEE